VDPTERRDPETVGIDVVPTVELVAMLIGRHLDVPVIVAQRAADIALAADDAAGRLEAGGRLAYAGSGTSGLLAEADALELPPTYGWPTEKLVVLKPGVGAEESAGDGRELAERLEFGQQDVVVGVSASGRTAFTVGAVEAARAGGALIIAITCNPDTRIAVLSDHPLEAVVGPEPIAGSTRMRAGLAQRLVLTVLSTAIMVRLGRTYDNLMVEVAPSLQKLRTRQEWIVAEACEVSAAEARRLLAAAGGNVKVAITMSLASTTRSDARTAIGRAGSVRGALRALTPDVDH
jgi:N-acetylmuramic acid 6-phosphate etherase